MNKENQAAATLKMNVFRIQLLGSKSDNQEGSYQQNTSTSQKESSSPSSNAPQTEPATVEEPADDLPF
jgi:single-stranded DNA-binding protein